MAFHAYGPSNKQPATVEIYQHRALHTPDRYYYDTQLHNSSGWGEGTVAFHAYPPGWMSKLPGHALLSQITLPGTHESMARFGYGSVCQQWTLYEQMATGVRVFDIRLRYMPGAGGRDNFSIHHGRDYQKAFFDSQFPYTPDAEHFVLDDCLEFLKDNPSECIVLLIKQEKDPQLRADFFRAFDAIINNRDGYNGKTLDKLFYTGQTVPRLEDVRGKIVFAFVDGDEGAGYQLTNPTYGLYWGNIDYKVDPHHLEPGQQPGLDVENHWRDIMDAKWSKVEAHLKSTLAWGPAHTDWSITYSSASRVELGNLPEDYANYLNPKVQAFLSQNLGAKSWLWGAYFGTVMMDFPTPDMIRLLIDAALAYQYVP